MKHGGGGGGDLSPSSNKNKNNNSITLPPHVYESSCLSYKGLLERGEDQSILVSGESGAGKTETVKILLRHFASVQQQQHDAYHSSKPTIAMTKTSSVSPRSIYSHSPTKATNENLTSITEYNSIGV